MKYKRSIITATAIVTVLTAGTVAAQLTTEPTPVKASKTTAKAVASDVQTESTEETPVEQVTPTQPVTNPAPSGFPTQTSNADANRARYKQAVTNASIALMGSLKIDASHTDEFVAVQWFCLDKFASTNQGYEDYDNLMASSPISVLTTVHYDENGTPSYSFFKDRGTCNVFTRTAE